MISRLDLWHLLESTGKNCSPKNTLSISDKHVNLHGITFYVSIVNMTYHFIHNYIINIYLNNTIIVYMIIMRMCILFLFHIQICIHLLMYF